MKQIWTAALILCALLAMTVTAQQRSSQTQAAEAALGAVIHQEEAEGNLEAAIASYKRFLAQYGNIRPLAAKAQFRLAGAYEKLGSPEAAKAYEQVARQFADQKEIAAEASRRLAGLNASLQSETPPQRVMMSGQGADAAWAVSGDGRWLALLDRDSADIAIRDTSSGETRRLNTKVGSRSDPGEAEAPAFSPDASQVSYTWFSGEKNSVYQLRLISRTPGAKPRILVDNPEMDFWSATWFPDGKSVLATVMRPDKTWQLARVSVPSGAVQIVKSLQWRLTGAMPAYFRPSISPDGRYIAYAAQANNPAGPNKPDGSGVHIYLLPSDGAGAEIELAKSANLNEAPQWTPDGSHIVFRSDISGKTGLWAVEMRNGKPASSPFLLRNDIGNTRVLGVTASGGYAYVALKPGVDQVSIIDLSDASRRVMESFVGMNPTWSPDGKSIAISRRVAPSGIARIVRSLQTGDEKVFRHENLTAYPALWLRNGDSMLQVIASAGKRGIHRIDLESGGFAEVPVPGRYSRLAAVSPDNRTLYFVSGDPNERGSSLDSIVTVDLSSGREQEVFRFPEITAESRVGVALSPDGVRFAIVAEESKTAEARLSIVSADGSGQRVIFMPFRTLAPGGKLAWTRDGRSVLIAVLKDFSSRTFEVMRIGVDDDKVESTGLTVKHLSMFDLSPDGARLAYSTTAEASSTAEVIAVDLPRILRTAAN